MHFQLPTPLTSSIQDARLNRAVKNMQLGIPSRTGEQTEFHTDVGQVEGFCADTEVA